MKRILLVGLFGLLAMPAWADPPNSALVVATCGTISPLFLAGRPAPLTVDVNGVNCTDAVLSGTVTANTTGHATAAAPSYVEGSDNALSITLGGNLRTTGVGGSFPVTAASGAIASGAVASGAIASGAVASGAYASGSIAAGAIAAGPTSLVKLEDVGAADADAGVPSMAIQQSTPADTGGTNADYTMLQMSAGRLWVSGGSTTAAAPPATVSAQGAVGSGATGGLMAGLKTCDLHAKYDASDNGNITLVTGVSGRKVYICGYILANGGTATNLSLTEGSDANCATNNAGLTPVYQILANQSVGVMSPFWAGLAVSTNAYFVCIKSSAGNAHQGEIWYTIQ